jgi:hypothetical protein
MELADLWKIGIGTILALFVLVGLFRFKNALRRSLFPSSEGKVRGEAMAELFALRARLEGRAGDSGSAEDQADDQGDLSGQEPDM